MKNAVSIDANLLSVVLSRFESRRRPDARYTSQLIFDYTEVRKHLDVLVLDGGLRQIWIDSLNAWIRRDYYSPGYMVTRLEDLLGNWNDEKNPFVKLYTPSSELYYEVDEGGRDETRMVTRHVALRDLLISTLMTHH